MSFSRIIRGIHNSWRLLAICAVVGLVLGGLTALLQDKTYIATATVLVSPNLPPGSFGQAPGADATFVAQRAQSYVKIGTSPRVLEPAASAAKLDHLNPSQVSVEWLANAPAILDITVTGPTAVAAADGANALAAQLTSIVQSLERPDRGGDATVRLSVSNLAEPPPSPASPKLMVNLLVGMLAGLAIGFPIVLGKLLFGRSVSDPDGFAEATGEPALALVGTAAADKPLVMRDAPQSGRAEAFRKLRTNVRFARSESAAQSIVVTAAQVGAGATTVACNLTLAIAEGGQQVVLVDANLREPAVSRLLGLQDGPGLAEVLAGRVELEAALQNSAPGCTVLVAGQGTEDSAGGLAGPRMIALLERLEKQADLVVVDAPAVLPYAAAAELAASAHAAVLVARYGKTKIDELQRARAALAQVGTTVLGVVINAVPEPDSRTDR